MKEDETKSNGMKKNDAESNELWQDITTPMTHEMIYASVAKDYPELFAGHELVKFEGGSTPTLKTTRRVVAK